MTGKISAVLTAGYTVTAGVMAAFALLASAGGHVDPGVQAETAGGSVQSVVVGGLGWRAGVRAGQDVVSIVPADAPGGWRIESDSGSHLVVASAGRAEALLRQSMVVAVVSAIAAATAIVLLRRRPRTPRGLAAIAAVLATVPLGIQNDPGPVGLALPVGLVLACGWIARWGIDSWPWRLVLGAATVAFVGGWFVLGGAQSPAFVAADDLRLGATVAAGGVVAIALVRGAVGGERTMSSGRRWLLDAVGLATVIVVVAVLVLSGVPFPVVGGAAVLLIVAYPFARRQTAATLDRLLFADLRDRMSIRAAEDERARLARDLHDAPLQELAGVIKRLELIPGVRAESDALRDVAQDLRSVAAELHPPVLHDLGLVAALDQAIRSSAVGDTPVAMHVEGSTSVRRSDRPPPEVELAVFRIALEAIANARRHAQSTQISVFGHVARASIEFSVEDDGVGITTIDQREAERAGHFGLHSMRRRAELIDAELTVGPGAGRGTRVRVRWLG
jgi:signal transduction histidine kinase